MKKKKSLFVATGDELRQEVIKKERGEELTKAMLRHFERFHSLSEIFDRDVEEQILLEELKNLQNPKQLNFEKGLVTFSPSSASKCERELYYKATRAEKDEQPMLPYQRRWVRNGSAVHAAVQKDLLLAEVHLKNPAFTVEKMEDGSPAWEHNLKNVKQFDYNDIRFQVFGMMDGILNYRDGSRIGFEFKTKSTTIGAVGNYKLKDAQESHKEQAIAYSLLFGIDEFIFVYESLAKDGWNKGVEAKPDIRAFYFKPSEEQKTNLLEKFARVAAMVERGELPKPEYDKCLFCPFKEVCSKDGDQ
ncbi:PD-(D/E)XK nuclease family protein [Terrihalobacillus insolitus]|uniref:PD-(D/E)XK nuclease family protein n=1 Tax=Terrihalobacillus insolitus TaxID=2950438 RepID=UPI0023422AE5|nr:PD-(D/E)XK nuclease family protein [Terrihalobacillus insolitus]MDC3413938.1 PD-(D/E)XK nuclease family protein [Terrihalobacillus insolitus]